MKSELDKYFSSDTKSGFKINCTLHLITSSKTDKFHRLTTSFLKKELNKSCCSLINYNDLITETKRLIKIKAEANTLASKSLQAFTHASPSLALGIVLGRYECARTRKPLRPATRYLPV
jgi:hypothetical protein